MNNIRQIVKDVSGLFFHACLPSIPDTNDKPFKFTFTLDIDTNVADLITNVLHRLHCEKDHYDYKYVMCVRFPNWEQNIIEIGDEGFLHYKEIIPGVNKWFDGKEFVDYNSFEGFQFIKFVKKLPKKEEIYVL